MCIRHLTKLLILPMVLPWYNVVLCQDANRVGIRNQGGQAKFYLTGTNQTLTPTGFNYIQLVHSPDGPYGESQYSRSKIMIPWLLMTIFNEWRSWVQRSEDLCGSLQRRLMHSRCQRA